MITFHPDTRAAAVHAAGADSCDLIWQCGGWKGAFTLRTRQLTIVPQTHTEMCFYPLSPLVGSYTLTAK